MRYLGRYSRRDLGPKSVVDRVLTACQLNEVQAAEPHTREFVAAEIASVFGRAGVRAALGSDAMKSAEPGLLRLFHHACRASLRPDDPWAASALAHALQEHTDDEPLWPALARHIARRSTTEDRVLLESLAGQPEQREGVLSWGLQYWVRGDLVLEDGSHLTLDDLADELGLPRLPLLEDQPPELELDVAS